MGDSEFGARGGPPPESDSYYHAGPPPPPMGYGGGPPPGGPEGYASPPPQGEYYQGENPQEKKKSDRKKYLLGGAAGLALGAAGGAFIAHEMGTFSPLLSSSNVDDVVWDGANWMQAVIVPPTRRKKGNMSVRRAKRRIRTTGMTIPRLMIGDCVRLAEYIGYVGKYEFQIISVVFGILHL